MNFFVDGNLITTKVTPIPGNKLDKSEKFVVTSKDEFNEDISIETSGTIYLVCFRIALQFFFNFKFFYIK